MIATCTLDGLTAGVHLVSPPPANPVYRLAGTTPVTTTTSADHGSPSSAPASTYASSLNRPLDPHRVLVLNLVRLVTRLMSCSGGWREFGNS
jgi:hypothetical protein